MTFDWGAPPAVRIAEMVIVSDDTLKPNERIENKGVGKQRGQSLRFPHVSRSHRHLLKNPLWQEA